MVLCVGARDPGVRRHAFGGAVHRAPAPEAALQRNFARAGAHAVAGDAGRVSAERYFADGAVCCCGGEREGGAVGEDRARGCVKIYVGAVLRPMWKEVDEKT